MADWDKNILKGHVVRIILVQPQHIRAFRENSHSTFDSSISEAGINTFLESQSVPAPALPR